MNQKRACKCTIFLGTNGTGKTTTLTQLMTATHERALIITPHDGEWCDFPINPLKTKEDFMFEGIQRHIFDPNYTLKAIQYYKCGSLVFDDCRAYLRASTNDIIHTLMISRRQRAIDIFAVGHGFTEVPPVFFTFATDYFLFKTLDSVKRRKEVLGQFYDLMQKSVEYINNKAKTEPHIFRHIKVM